MSSLTFFFSSPLPLTQISTIQTFEFTSPKNKPKPKRTGKESQNPSRFACFSCKKPSFEPEVGPTSERISSGENADSNFSDSQSQRVDSVVLASWLQSCKRLRDVKRVHAVALRCLESRMIYLDNNLISSYSRLGSLIDARRLFDEMPERNVVSWTAMINRYLRFGFVDEAFALLHLFLEKGIHWTNERLFVCVLNLCSKRMDYEFGKQIHGQVVKGENVRNLIVDSSVVYFYAECGKLSDALRAFDRMPEKDVVSWTAIISACSRKGCVKEVFLMFSRMLSHGFLPNEFTICSVLKACSEEKQIRVGRQLHGLVVKNMVKNDVFVGTSLVDLYAKCGEISDSRKVFEAMRYRNTITWTSIIAAYARQDIGEEALILFRLMRRRNMIANHLTLLSVLRACGSIGALFLGKEVHAQIIKNSIEKNIYIGTTLVWFYCKCGEYHNAFAVLQQMPLRDAVSWTAMISGCSSLGHESEALEFLKEMIKEGVEPNPFTYSSALKACTNAEALLLGKSIHSVAKKNPAVSNVFVGTALIHMYSKCGFVAEASKVFNGMPEKNFVSWKAMILGYARNGFCREALKLMYRMKAEGFEVDHYILATIVSACGDFEWDAEDPGVLKPVGL